MANEWIYQCIHCGDVFKNPKRLRFVNRLCPYCESVVRGQPDGRWLCKNGRGEKLSKSGLPGF